MKHPLTVVMYHYVRPIAGSRYPQIKGLELEAFEGQLDYLARHHRFVSAREVVEASRGGNSLPPHPVLLTFDDGYADHHDHVFPALSRRGITGAFFPPSGTALDRRMLDVNKIHFILASASDPEELVRAIEAAVDEHRKAMGLASLASYREQFHVANRFDGAAVIYVKRMLQRGLPPVLRHAVTDALFRRFVTQDEPSFVDELYLDVADLKEMASAGMEIGSHGHAHHWLDSLGATAQEADIEQSLRLLDETGSSRKDFLFCYPYGAHNDDTVAILQAKGCAAAFTTEVALARPTPSTLLRLPRLDTNDLPKDARAEPVDWTIRSRGNARP